MTQLKKSAIAGLMMLVGTTLTSTAQGLKDAYKNYFTIGVALNQRNVSDNAQKALVCREFNSVTAENDMKPGELHPKEGEWKCTGIQTLKYTIRATKESFRLIANCCHTYPGFNDPTNIFLSNIQDISLVVNSYDSDTFKVGLHCKLPCVSGDSKTLNENYLYYEFKKR